MNKQGQDQEWRISIKCYKKYISLNTNNPNQSQEIIDNITNSCLNRSENERINDTISDDSYERLSKKNQRQRRW